MIDSPESTPVDRVLHVTGVFDTAAVSKLRHALLGTQSNETCVIDATGVREFQGLALAGLADALRQATHRTIQLVGLRPRELTLLRRLGTARTAFTTRGATTVTEFPRTA